MAFLFNNLVYTSASNGGRYPSNNLEEAVVGISFVEKLSLIAKGMPHKGLSTSTSCLDNSSANLIASFS